MRTVAAFIMVSLDGFFEGPDHGLDWHHVGEEFNAFAITQLDAADTLVFGRVTYELMAGYWPTDEGLADDAEVATRMNEKPKLVATTTLTDPAWHNTRVMRDPVVELGRLRRGRGGDILVLGSARLTTSLAVAGVLDELRLMVNPVALGRGRAIFDSIDRSLPMRLLAVRRFESGNVLLTWRPEPDGAA